MATNTLDKSKGAEISYSLYYDEKKTSYNLGVSLHEDGLDEEIKKRLDGGHIHVILLSANCEIDPLRSVFISTGGMYKTEKEFQVIPQEEDKDAFSDIEAVLLINNHAIASHNLENLFKKVYKNKKSKE